MFYGPFLCPCLTGPCVVPRTPQLLPSFSKMPTVVCQGQQSRPHTAQMIFLCCTQRMLCSPHYLTSVWGRLSLDASHPEVTLSRFYALRSESAVQQRRKSLPPKGNEKKRRRQTEVPSRLAARGQTVADSAETGQLTRCSHGPPVCVPITAPDFHQKKKKTLQMHKMPTFTSLPQALILLLIRS